jgi:hypothetical protein
MIPMELVISFLTKYFESCKEIDLIDGLQNGCSKEVVPLHVVTG